MFHSLRNKLTFGVTFIEVTFFLMLALMVSALIREALEEDLEKKAKITSELFATLASDAVMTYDLASLDTFVNQMLSHEDIIYARILDADRNKLATAGTVSTLDDWKADESIQSVIDRSFDIEKPISLDGETFGYIQIGMRVDFINNAVHEIQILIAGVAVVEVLFISAVSFVFSSYLIRQLYRLKDSAEEVANRLSNGEPIQERIDIIQTDHEVKLVAESFNALIDALNQQVRRSKKFQHELFSLNSSLEEQVINRTAMLKESNIKLKNINKDLKETQTQLTQAEKLASVGQLAAGVAHEINNPVGFVKSNLSILQDYMRDIGEILEELPAFLDSKDVFERRRLQLKISDAIARFDLLFMLDDIKEILSDSDEGLKRVTEIVGGLKTFSRADDDKKQLFSINECIETTLKMVNNELKYHCKIEKKLAPNLPDIEINVGKIIQVLTNLLVNAGHAVSQNGLITIKSEVIDDNVVVTVSDNGKGIEQEHLDHLFDPFFTTKAEGEGTGLGLSISLNIIEEHEGKIDVQSCVGEGTSFYVTLPIYSTGSIEAHQVREHEHES